MIATWIEKVAAKLKEDWHWIVFTFAFQLKLWTKDKTYTKKPVSLLYTQKSCNFLLVYFILCCVQHLAPSPVTINIVLLLECYVWEFSSFFYMSDCFLCKCLWFYVLAVLLVQQLQFFSLRRISITKLWSLSFILLLLRLHRGFYCFLWIFPIVPLPIISFLKRVLWCQRFAFPIN